MTLSSLFSTEPDTYNATVSLRTRLENLFAQLYSQLAQPISGPYPPAVRLGSLHGTEELREPAMEWQEDDNQIILRFLLPGIRQDNVDVEVLGNVLTIVGRIEEETNLGRADEVLYREVIPGCFQRIVPLPFIADPDTAHATIQDGILEVTLPKPQRQSKGRKPIPINPYFGF